MEAWKILYNLQDKYKTCGFSLHKWLDQESIALRVKQAIKLTPQRGSKRLTVRDFAEKYRSGCFIVRVAKHVACIRDGSLYDTWDCSRKCVYKAWRF